MKLGPMERLWYSRYKATDINTAYFSEEIFRDLTYLIHEIEKYHSPSIGDMTVMEMERYCNLIYLIDEALGIIAIRWRNSILFGSTRTEYNNRFSAFNKDLKKFKKGKL